MSPAASPWRSGLLVAAVAFGPLAVLCSVPAPAQEKTPPPPAQKPVNYREPAREYEKVRLGGWTVWVEKPLLSREPALARRALARLEKKLGEALEALPKPAHVRLKCLSIYLMYGPRAPGGGRDNGLEYFQKTAPKHHPDLDPRWGSCLVIYSAENYLWLPDFWARKALVHEFAHAHHLEQWPEDQPDILAAWRNATKRGLYRGVKDDRGQKLERAYADVNQLEYFAELSCMYFVGCNYQPFTRAELKAYDPVGYALVEKMWGVKKGR